jgi:integrase
MEEPPLSKQALARIEAARQEAGADLLSGLAAFWRRTGMSSKSLREHDPAELMPLFERYAEVTEFPLYTFRHTCLTRWAAHMDPYTLGYLAGHSDFSTTRRYVHPQAHTVREAMERARNGHDNATPGTDTAQSG